jgi:hypothetical protein
MVTMVPMRINCLITSAAFIDIFWASSPTVTVSGTGTSRTTGAVGRWKPCSPLAFLFFGLHTRGFRLLTLGLFRSLARLLFRLLTLAL